jgi:hypothetical protein
MSESAIRAAVYAAVNGVTNKGVCYDYERWANTWPAFLALFKTTISGTAQIRGWEVGYRGHASRRDPQFARQVIHDHRFIVQGYMGLDDSAATEKTFATLAEAVVAAIDASSTLHSGAYTLTGPASIDAHEPRMFSDTLCHYALISLTVSEQVS